MEWMTVSSSLMWKLSVPPVIKFNRCNLLSYEYVFNSGERLVYRRWTRSMHSCLPWGDHSIELYSSKCIRHTQWKHTRVAQCLVKQNCVELHWRVGVPLWLFAWYGLLVLKIYFQDTFAVKAYLLIAYEGLTGQITAKHLFLSCQI